MSRSSKLPERTERRYVMPANEEFLLMLQPHFEERVFSENRFVQTVYFNDSEHSVPFSLSIKARRYLGAPSSGVDEKAQYFLEVKSGNGAKKNKTRTSMALGEIAGFLNGSAEFYHCGLRPYIMTVYRRKHLAPRSQQGFRITVDNDVQYFFFPDGGAVPIGSEDGLMRVELKEEFPGNMPPAVASSLLEAGALPTISKKSKAYHYLNRYRSSTAKRFKKELVGYELESKLGAPSEDVFREAKEMFRSEPDGFRLLRHFPYTIESGSIQRYYRQGSRICRISFMDYAAYVTEKSEPEFVENPLGLGA